MKLLFNTKINEKEKKVATKAGLKVIESRLDAKNETVICRYGVLPHYQELELDLKKQGSRLINSYDEHIMLLIFNIIKICKTIHLKHGLIFNLYQKIFL